MSLTAACPKIDIDISGENLELKTMPGKKRG
jgi:hypothetical protein